MKEIKVSVNTWYVVEGTAGATVINPSTNKAIATVEEGKQTAFFATTPYVLVSDDSVNVFKATFNLAPAKLRLLGLLGGGASTGSALPSGYIAAEFLESTGRQYIITPFRVGGASSVRCVFYYTEAKNGTFPFGTCDGFPVNMFRIARDYDKWAVQYADKTKYVSGEIGIKIDFRLKAGATTLNGTPIDVNYVAFETESPLFIFVASQNGVLFTPQHIMPGRIYLVEIDETNTLVAAVDNNGIPCMYDKTSKQTFYNKGSGAFIVGMTCTQALKLANLPSTGGTLTISLPSNWQEDEGVVNALATAEANGWVFTYQTYEADASTASTFALRRIFVRKTQNENGQYVAADGSRWHVEWCVGMIGAEPTDHGYEPFRSVDAAVAYWELTPWVDPEAEKSLTELEQ